LNSGTFRAASNTGLLMANSRMEIEKKTTGSKIGERHPDKYRVALFGSQARTSNSFISCP
jgi:hypothetical protein